MLIMSWRHYLSLYITAGICISVCSGIVITRFVSPSLVHSSNKYAIFDCQFKLKNETSDGLTIRWYYKDRSGIPIYQRTYDKPAESWGPFKEHIDLEYGFSNNTMPSSASLRLLNPTISMNGQYFCVVSKPEHEASKSGPLQVYSPGKNLKLYHKKIDADSVKLVCTAEDIHPHVELKILTQSGAVLDSKTDAVLGSDGLFDVKGTAVLNNNSLNDTQVFSCQKILTIGYFSTKETKKYVLKKTV